MAEILIHQKGIGTMIKVYFKLLDYLSLKCIICFISLIRKIFYTEFNYVLNIDLNTFIVYLFM